MAYTEKDQASVNQTVRVGVETTPGTLVVASKLLQSISISPGVTIEIDEFRPAGSKFVSLMVPNREWAEADIEGKPTYDELPYLLSSVSNYAAPTSPGSTAKLWTFTGRNRGADTIKTLTVEWGSDSYWQKSGFGLVTGVGLQFSRTAVEMSGNMIMQRIDFSPRASSSSTIYTLAITGTPTGGSFTLTVGAQTTGNIAYNAAASAVQTALEALSTVGPGNVVVTGGALPGTGVTIYFINDKGDAAVTLTGTFTGLSGGSSPNGTLTATQTGAALTTIPLKPVLSSDVDLYMADSYAGLATADPLERAFALEWNLTDKYAAIWPIRSANTSFAGYVEQPPTANGTLKLSMDTSARSLMAFLRSGGTKFLRLKAIGDNIEVGHDYTLQIDMAVQFSEVSGPEDEDGIFMGTYSFNMVPDSTMPSSSPYEIQIKNTLAAL